jgi:hypothetical protein
MSLANRLCSGYNPTCTRTGRITTSDRRPDAASDMRETGPPVSRGGHSLHRACQRARPLAQCCRRIGIARPVLMPRRPIGCVLSRDMLTFPEHDPTAREGGETLVEEHR